KILKQVLEILLKLLHPYVPFVTEKIWAEIPLNTPLRKGEEKELLAASEWPEEKKQLINSEAEQDFELLKEIITKIRTLRTDKNVEASKSISVTFSGKNLKVLRENENILKVLARLEKISYDQKIDEEGVTDIVSGTEIFIPLAGMFDPAEEKKRLQ